MAVKKKCEFQEWMVFKLMCFRGKYFTSEMYICRWHCHSYQFLCMGVLGSGWDLSRVCPWYFLNASWCYFPTFGIFTTIRSPPESFTDKFIAWVISLLEKSSLCLTDVSHILKSFPVFLNTELHLSTSLSLVK